MKMMSMGALAALSLGSSACTQVQKEEFLQKRFREMTEAEKKGVIRRLEETYLRKYAKKFRISTQPAEPAVLWGYGLDLSRCIGCRRCVYACVKENNPSRINPQLQWIRVIRLKKGSLVNLENSEHYYDPETVPEPGFMYMPVQCQQCDNPPCVRVCPVKATWKEPDGIVVVDYNWCIGCRYCMAACPYKGRVFNWSEPNIPAEELNTEVHYLGNRPRPAGVVEKCFPCVAESAAVPWQLVQESGVGLVHDAIAVVVDRVAILRGVRVDGVVLVVAFLAGGEAVLVRVRPGHRGR